MSILLLWMCGPSFGLGRYILCSSDPTLKGLVHTLFCLICLLLIAWPSISQGAHKLFLCTLICSFKSGIGWDLNDLKPPLAHLHVQLSSRFKYSLAKHKQPNNNVLPLLHENSSLATNFRSHEKPTWMVITVAQDHFQASNEQHKGYNVGNLLHQIYEKQSQYVDWVMPRSSG